MDAIVSLLDEDHGRRLEKIWRELCSRFGLGSGFATRYPHFSFLSAENMESSAVDATLTRLARELGTITVRTSGLGYFPGESPVIFLPVVRTAGLSQLHQRIWSDCRNAVVDPSPLFSPETWIPHITLALDGLSDIDPIPVIAWLAGLDLSWTIDIRNLAVISNDGELRRFDFGRGEPVANVSAEG
jgi:hypothetical protein